MTIYSRTYKPCKHSPHDITVDGTTVTTHNGKEVWRHFLVAVCPECLREVSLTYGSYNYRKHNSAPKTVCKGSGEPHPCKAEFQEEDEGNKL